MTRCYSRAALSRGRWCYSRSVLLAVALLVPPCLRAQKQPALFVHGLHSDQNTWQFSADQLKVQAPIAPYRMSLSKYGTYLQQALELKAFAAGQGAGLPDTTLSIGHSNGGVVSRYAVANGMKLRGVVAVGTPQSGAPLIDNILNNNVAGAGAIIANTVFAPFYYYGQYSESWPWVIGRYAGQFMYDLGFFMNDIVSAGLDLHANDALFADMRTTAPIWATLNGAANLSAEATKVRTRVEVLAAVQDPWLGSIWHGVAAPYWGPLTQAQLAAFMIFMDLYDHYSYYYDPSDPWSYQKQQGAGLWFGAALVTIWINDEWCWLIGAYSNGCLSHDGIVPVTRQQYPGRTHSHPMAATAHSLETQQFASKVGTTVLYGDFGLQPCGATPAAYATITNLPPNVGVNYTATLTGTAYNLCDLSMTGQPISWTSSNTAVATVTGSGTYGTQGIVTGRSVGYADITASAGGKAGAPVTIRVTATSAPALTAVAILGTTQTIRNCPTTWTALPTGGQTPITYRWTVDGVQKQNGPANAFTYTPTSTTPFNLVLTATDARGDVKSSPTTRVTVLATGTCQASIPAPTR